MAFLLSCNNNIPLEEPKLEGEDQVLIDFYQQKPVTFKDRKVNIKDFWNYSNDELESAHNYIQWLFPNAREGLSPAPVLSTASVKIMRTDPEIKKKYIKIF